MAVRNATNRNLNKGGKLTPAHSNKQTTLLRMDGNTLARQKTTLGQPGGNEALITAAYLPAITPGQRNQEDAKTVESGKNSRIKKGNIKTNKGPKPDIKKVGQPQNLNTVLLEAINKTKSFRVYRFDLES